MQSSADEEALAVERSKRLFSPPTTWAKGVGTAFELLRVEGGVAAWTPIVHDAVLELLRQLVAVNETHEVRYVVDGKAYVTSMRADGLLAQRDAHTGATSVLRLVPCFFEYSAGRGVWSPITAPEALTALTAVLASSYPRRYRVAQPAEGPAGSEYEATLANEQGLLLQTNTRTGTMRSVRATAIGPDGNPHFEYLAEEKDWKPGTSNWLPLPDEVCPMLAACAAGHGDCHYTLEGTPYAASLSSDGFLDCRNLRTQLVRPLRPAPWLGHGRAKVVDPTNCWVPTAEVVYEGSSVGVPVYDAARPLVYDAQPPAYYYGTEGAGGGVPAALPVLHAVAPIIYTAAPIVESAVAVAGAELYPQQASDYYVPMALPMGTAVDPVEIVVSEYF